MKLKMKISRKKAFTLVEILIAISIISIIAVISVVSLNSSRANSRDTKRVSDIRQMQTALRMYYNDYKRYPTTAEWGTKLATGSSVYLESIPQAPGVADGDCGASSTAYIYESDGKTYNIKFCTGSKVGDYVAGFKEATPDGIVATSSPVVAPPREPTWRVVANSSIPGTGSTGTRAWNSVDVSADGQIVMLGTNGGYLYRSIDGGNTFSELTSLGTGLTWYVACSSDGTKMAASNVNLVSGSYKGPIFLSTDSGATWTTSAGAGTRYWTGVAISDDGNTVLGVVYQSYPFVSINAGSTWTQRGNYGYYHNCRCSADCSKMLASPSGSYINISSNSGTNWSQIASMSIKTWYAVAISNSGAKMAVGSMTHPSYPVTVFYVSTDYGATWSLREPLAGRQWISAAYAGDGSKLIASDYGGYLYVSTNDGQSWTAQTALGVRNWGPVASSLDGNKVVVSVINGDIYIYD